jgi:hypothetical protein
MTLIAMLAAIACANDAAPSPTPTVLPPLLRASLPAPYHAKIVLTRGTSPAVTLVSSTLPLTATLDLQIQTLRAPMQLSNEKIFARAQTQARPHAGDLVDNWDLLVSEDAEDSSDARCAARDWLPNDARAWSGKTSLAPKPNAWLICGPFDLSNARDVLTQFMLFADAKNFSWGISTDGQTFTMLRWNSPAALWVRYDVWANGWDGEARVWLAFVAQSDAPVWLDDVRVWRYNSPAVMCGNRDAGNKGVHLPSHELVNAVWYPIVRAGDTQALQGLIDANASWVRLGFRQPDATSPYTIEQEYDRIVDSLCAAGISVLGLLNQESLPQPLSDAPAYRQAFAKNVWWYAVHFKQRIKFWELWNEPNLPTLRIAPQTYAALLTESYRALGAGNAQAKLIFGGLGSAWNDSNEYLDQVYFYLNREQGGARPFDAFALHLYFGDKYALDPAIYLRASDQMDATQGDRTIIDKFARTMTKYGDVTRKIWVTEIGWNSSKNEKNAPPLAIEQATQAQYLKTSFDILLNEARGIAKIFWYQYHDVIGADRVPGFWGLYGTDKRTPKPALCAFAVYPKDCK